VRLLSNLTDTHAADQNDVAGAYRVTHTGANIEVYRDLGNGFALTYTHPAGSVSGRFKLYAVANNAYGDGVKSAVALDNVSVLR